MCEFCDRPSALPEGYPPRCGRHYLQDVREARDQADRRTAAAVKALTRGDRDEALKILHTPLEQFAKPIKR